MNFQDIKREIKVRTSRSSGSGGQHVNKVSTKVELIWDLQNTELFTEPEKRRINNRLKTRINKEGLLVVTDQSSRSQLLNRRSAFKKLEKLLKKALEVNPIRRGNGKPKVDQAKRLKQKRIQSEKKKLREKISLSF